MRYIYIDEAGRSAPEPVTVVVGIVVHADAQYRLAEEKLSAVLQTIPEHIRQPGFIVSAKRVWGDERLRDRWEPEARHKFLTDMASIPCRLRLPIAIGYSRRTDPLEADLDQIEAFALCVAQADYFVREYGGEDEVATVVAEDVPDKKLKESLREAARSLRDEPWVVLPEQNFEARQLDTIKPLEPEYRITRVKDTIHFVEKQDGPLLQIADACAWGFKRYVEGKDFGSEMYGAMAAGMHQFREVLPSNYRTEAKYGSVLICKPTRDFGGANYRWTTTRVEVKYNL